MERHPRQHDCQNCQSHGFRLEEMNNTRNGLPWTVARSKYVPFVKSPEEVQKWRAKQTAKQKPSTFKDYCAAHGRCVRCESTGIVLDERRGGFKSAGSYEGESLFERCKACDGTGVEAAWPMWRRRVEEIDRH